MKLDREQKRLMLWKWLNEIYTAIAAHAKDEGAFIYSDHKRGR